MAQEEERDGNGKPNGNNAEIVPLVHKVEVPPTRNDFAIIGSGFYEFFFHNAPLNQFKGQSRRQKGLLGLKVVFPILDWITTYTRRLLLADFAAGCTIASLAIPQDLGFARLAGVPPANGLYSSFVPPLVYSVFGRCRDIAIGPLAVVSRLLGTLLKQEISPDNPEDYLNLAFTASFFCGVFQTGLGVFRLGFVTKFLSHATIVRFMAGAAVTTALQQLRGLLNITLLTSETDFISVMKSVFGHIDEWNWRSIVIGLAFLGFLISKKIMVCFSFVKILYNVTRPYTARLRTAVTNVYRIVTQHPNAGLAPGVLTIRVDAAIYFSNFNYIHGKILHYLEEETQKLPETGGARIQHLIVDSTPVTNIDTSRIVAFEELEKILKRKKIQLAFANPGALVIVKLDDSKF